MPESFATPICHVPAGSGNALSATCGLWTPATAVHALVKGSVKPVDAASVFLASESVPRLSILSVQYGLLSNLDIGTEHLRKLLGGERFTYGAVREILKWRRHKANIAFFKEPAEVSLMGQQPGCVDVFPE
jgi:diacylglycerol kinase family enzyme